jgi:hypothetical protein
VKLHGGAFDGKVGEVSPHVLSTGFLVVERCPEHGDNAECDCENTMWYGYFAEIGKGAGHFEEVSA